MAVVSVVFNRYGTQLIVLIVTLFVIEYVYNNYTKIRRYASDFFRLMVTIKNFNTLPMLIVA